jgi:hypothetical protein
MKYAAPARQSPDLTRRTVRMRDVLPHVLLSATDAKKKARTCGSTSLRLHFRASGVTVSVICLPSRSIVTLTGTPIFTASSA